MPSHEAAHIMALIRSGNIVNIGGRPVLVTSSSKLESRRTYSIQLALAFAAIYLVWGSTYLAIRYAVEPFHRWSLRASGTLLPAQFCSRGHGRVAFVPRVPIGSLDLFWELCFF